MGVFLAIAGSSNGRTHASGAWYPGSNPGPAVLWIISCMKNTKSKILKEIEKSQKEQIQFL